MKLKINTAKRKQKKKILDFQLLLPENDITCSPLIIEVDFHFKNKCNDFIEMMMNYI